MNNYKEFKIRFYLDLDDESEKKLADILSTQSSRIRNAGIKDVLKKHYFSSRPEVPDAGMKEKTESDAMASTQAAISRIMERLDRLEQKKEEKSTPAPVLPADLPATAKSETLPPVSPDSITAHSEPAIPFPEPELAASNQKTVDLEIPEDLLDYIDTL